MSKLSEITGLPDFGQFRWPVTIGLLQINLMYVCVCVLCFTESAIWPPYCSVRNFFLFGGGGGIKGPVTWPYCAAPHEKISSGGAIGTVLQSNSSHRCGVIGQLRWSSRAGTSVALGPARQGGSVPQRRSCAPERSGSAVRRHPTTGPVRLSGSPNPDRRWIG